MSLLDIYGRPKIMYRSLMKIGADIQEPKLQIQNTLTLNYKLVSAVNKFN